MKLAERKFKAKDLCLEIDSFKLGETGTVDGIITRDIELVARTSKPVSMWGYELHHELSGMLRKDKVPIDWLHDNERPIGFLDKFDVNDERIKCSGQLISTQPGDAAGEIMKRGDAGLPYESSIFFGGTDLRAKELGKDEEMTVNGKTVTGPDVIVFTQWPLRGVAICPYGADNATSVQFDQDEEFTISFLPNKEKDDMAEDAKKLEQADKLALIKASEKTEEPDKVVDKGDKKPTGPMSPDGFVGKDFLDAFGEHGAVLFAEGKTFAEASAIYITELEEQVKELQAKLASIDRGLKEPVSTDGQSDEDVAKQAKIANLTEKIGSSRARFAASINL